MQLTRKSEIREVLTQQPKKISFPEWVPTNSVEGEARTIQFMMPGGKLVLISATSYQTLKIEEL